MRLLMLFVLGAILGAAIALLAANALQQRSAYPRGVMAVMQHHLGSLRELTQKPGCDVAASTSSLQRLRHAAEDIEPALYPDSPPDPTLHKYADKLRSALDQALAAPAANCAALSQSVAEIADHCDRCHREFR